MFVGFQIKQSERCRRQVVQAGQMMVLGKSIQGFLTNLPCDNRPHQTMADAIKILPKTVTGMTMLTTRTRIVRSAEPIREQSIRIPKQWRIINSIVADTMCRLLSLDRPFSGFLTFGQDTRRTLGTFEGSTALWFRTSFLQDSQGLLQLSRANAETHDCYVARWQELGLLLAVEARESCCWPENWNLSNWLPKYWYSLPGSHQLLGCRWQESLQHL